MGRYGQEKVWLRIQIGGGRFWTSWFSKIWRVPWLAQDLLVSQEKLRSVEVVTYAYPVSENSGRSPDQRVFLNKKHDVINTKNETRVYVTGKEKPNCKQPILSQFRTLCGSNVNEPLTRQNSFVFAHRIHFGLSEINLSPWTRPRSKVLITLICIVWAAAAAARYDFDCCRNP